MVVVVSVTSVVVPWLHVLSLSRQLLQVVVVATWCVIVAKVPLNGHCSSVDECSSPLAQCVVVV